MTQQFENPQEKHPHRLLRRLQELSRSNIPALMTQRAMSTFTLHPEPEPEPATHYIVVLVYPQNPFTSEPEVRRMNIHDIGSELVNSRLQVRDLRGAKAVADEDGHYLYWPGTPEFDQVNAFYYASFTLRMYERYAGRSIPWAFPSPRLTISPSIGNEGNAFYHEQDKLLGFHLITDAKGESFSTAQSADIVSHETAHAVLDGLRDLYNESFGLGPTAFHESFGDISAVLVAMHDDTLIKQVLSWTKGNLRTSNIISEIAEQISAEHPEGVDSDTIYLRNAFNHLSYQPYDQLPYVPTHPSTELGRQPHNYSRLFTGAFYDIIVGLYERLSAQMQPYIAIYRARDIAGRILTTAIELGPVGEFDFSDMARAFLSAESILYDGRYNDVLRTVFNARGILSDADATEHLRSLAHIADIYLPDTLNTAMAAALFLEEIAPQLALPQGVEWLPLTAYRNARGIAYLTYFNSQPLTLNGAEYQRFEGATIDLFGGLTLMFDTKGKLRSRFMRLVTDEDRRQIRQTTAELIQMGMVSEDLSLDIPVLKPHPQMLYLPLDESNARIVKSPIIIDSVPQPIPTFLNYLRSWKNKLR